jgi:hypothetical protein
MPTASTQAGAAPAPKGLISRFIGVLTSPRETFQAVVAHPKWFGMLATTVVIISLFAALPMTTEDGQQAALDQQVSQREAITGPMSDADYERMRAGRRFFPVMAAVFVLVFSPIIVLILSGVLFAVFSAAMGGDASFKQVFAVVVHSGVVSALSAMFTGPLNYFRGAVGSATNLGVLLPMIDDKSFVGRLLAAVDLFLIWWVVVLAIGLAVLYRRRTQPIAIALLCVYAVIALTIAAVMSAMGGRS